MFRCTMLTNQLLGVRQRLRASRASSQLLPCLLQHHYYYTVNTILPPATPGDAPVARVFGRRPAGRSTVGQKLKAVTRRLVPLGGASQTTDTEPPRPASDQGGTATEEREMPDEAVDGDTEGRSRDDKTESEESDERTVVAMRKNSDSEVEGSAENVKDLRVRYELANFEEVKEEGDHDDDDDDDDDDDNDDEFDDGDDYNSEGEDSWFNRVQKKRNEEEKDYVWLRKVDRGSHVKAMAPVYHLLEVRSASPLQVDHVRQAVSHLSRMWPWWDINVRHRGQERTPWLCLAPTQRPILQVSGDDYEEDEDNLWDLMDQQQWRHTKMAEGLLSTVTLITHPRLSAAAAAVAATPHSHRNDGIVTAADGGSGAADASAAASTTTPGAATLGEVQTDGVPDLPHRIYLMLGIPRPFVDDTKAEVICRTLITLLDDILTGRIQGEYQSSQKSGSDGKDTAEAKSPGLEAWLAERLQVVAEAKIEGGDNNADPESGCSPDEENEYDTRGYIQRTFDSVISRNFINRCKAERVSYVNGFATCVSTGAAAFLLAAEEKEGREHVVIRQRVCEHLHWPAGPSEWQDGDPDEESPPRVSNTPPGVTITAPTGEDDAEFWETVKLVSCQRWGAPTGGNKEAALHIHHALRGEDSEDDMPLQRYPSVSLRLCDIQKGKGGAPAVQRIGNLVALGPHSLSPLRHFLFTHTINLHLEEGSQVLSFSLHHSTLFLSPGTGKSFADEIERALKNSLKRR